MKKLISLMLTLTMIGTTLTGIALSRGVDKIEYGKDGWKTIYVSSENLDDFLNKISSSEDINKCIENARTLKAKDVLTTSAPYTLPILSAFGSYKIIKYINSKMFEPNKVKADIQRSGKSHYIAKSLLITVSEIFLSSLASAVSFVIGFYINTKNNLFSQLSKCDDLNGEYKCIYKSFYPNYDNMQDMPAFLDLTMKRDQRRIRLMRANGMKAKLNGWDCEIGAVEPQSWNELLTENLLPATDTHNVD